MICAESTNLKVVPPGGFFEKVSIDLQFGLSMFIKTSSS